MQKFTQTAKFFLNKSKNLAIPIGLLIIWILLGDSMKPAILPSFKSVMDTLLELIQNGEMWLAWKTSLYRIGVATLLSVVISLPLALLAKSFKFIQEIVTPFTNFMRFIPVTVFYPLLIAWVGIDEQMKITFLFIATFFVFFPSVMLTLKGISKNLVEVALTSGASKWQLVKNVYIPAALPNLCQSFLSMFSVGFTYMIISENTNARYGLGHLMLIGGARGYTDMVFAAVLITIITGAIIDIVGNLIIKKSFKWYFAKEEIK